MQKAKRLPEHLGVLKVRDMEYEIKTEILCSEELGEYVTYGVNAYEGPVLVASVSDVSTDYEAVRELVRKINDGQLDPIHFSEVLADWLISS